jgi:hypothetical protein
LGATCYQNSRGKPLLRKGVLNSYLIIALIVFSIVFFGWVGLHFNPRPFPPITQKTGVIKTVPIPRNLPMPVKRFYQQVYGEKAPLIKSVVISGRARLRVAGITFPGRFRFTHDAGKAYHHYLEATFFGLPLMKVNEYYMDGKCRLELPFGVTEGEPKVDQAANLGMWSESLWLPSILITDPGVRWETIDADTSLLVVPFGEIRERFIVRFDPKTGLVTLLEGMRYKGTTDEIKTLWLNVVLDWVRVDGHMLAKAAIIWQDEGTPWAFFTPEEVAYNVDVKEYIRMKGA